MRASSNGAFLWAAEHVTPAGSCAEEAAGQDALMAVALNLALNDAHVSNRTH